MGTLSVAAVAQTRTRFVNAPRAQRLRPLRLVAPLPRAATSTPAPAPAPAPAAPTPAYLADLLVACPDQKGVVASLAQLLFGYGCNIISADQFSDTVEGRFYQRLHVDYSDLIVGVENVNVLENALRHTAQKFDMTWSISYARQRKRVAIAVSRSDHCLYDLLIRHQAGELPCDIPVILSNHASLASVAAQFGVPFRHLPMPPAEAHGGDKDAAKTAQEAAIEELLAAERIDLLVLARYMQVMSPGFCERHWRHTINIHHSFLPAFEGGRPYHRAHERGVKIIGATSHYATAELDAGPIIDQDTARISHRDSVDTMIRKGKDLERVVLARAVRAHLDNRVIVAGNKTVVFDE